MHTPESASVDPSYVPRLKASVVAMDLEDGLVVYDPEARLVHHLNPWARIVWQVSDGNATARQLAEEIADVYGLKGEQVWTDVSACLAELERAGLVEDAGRGRRSE